MRPKDEENRRNFVIAETSVAGAMVVVALVVAAVAHAPVFGGVLLLFAGVAFGHALAVHLGLAHPPRGREQRERRPRRR
jgi:uncharacterized membrane protein YdjX (TVP38/TMEM64 family)